MVVGGAAILLITTPPDCHPQRRTMGDPGNDSKANLVFNRCFRVRIEVLTVNISCAIIGIGRGEGRVLPHGG